MILFVTYQAAGAEYLRPLIALLAGSGEQWQILAGGPSVAVWRRYGFEACELPEVGVDWFRQRWREWQPRIVVTSASVGSRLESTARAAAASEGVPSAAFVDMWSGYGTRFEHGLADYLLAIDERCADEMEADGLPADRIRIVGQPAWERFLTRADGHPADSRDVLLASQPLAKYYGRSLGYTEKELIEVALEGLARAAPGTRVRLGRHPEEHTGEDADWPPELDVVEMPGRGVADVLDCAAVLGAFSTQLVLGFLAGRRVISVQPGSRGEDPCPLSRWGLVPRARQPSELVEAWRREGSSPDQARALRRSLVGSAERLAAFCRGC